MQPHRGRHPSSCSTTECSANGACCIDSVPRALQGPAWCEDRWCRRAHARSGFPLCQAAPFWPGVKSRQPSPARPDAVDHEPALGVRLRWPAVLVATAGMRNRGQHQSEVLAVEPRDVLVRAHSLAIQQRCRDSEDTLFAAGVDAGRSCVDALGVDPPASRIGRTLASPAVRIQGNPVSANPVRISSSTPASMGYAPFAHARKASATGGSDSGLVTGPLLLCCWMAPRPSRRSRPCRAVWNPRGRVQMKMTL